MWLALLSPVAGQDVPDTLAGQDMPDTLSGTYRDWVLTCAAGTGPDAPPSRRCDIAQALRTAETGQRVLRMALVPGTDGAAAVTLVTPFGVRVADGVGISAGSAGTAGRRGSMS